MSVDQLPRFRWVEVLQNRHAVAFVMCPGQSGRTLCGRFVTLPYVLRRLGFAPECQVCDDAWRREIGVRTRAEVLAGSPRRCHGRTARPTPRATPSSGSG
ncbi:zinc finger protein [Actinosynnema sp. CS-041913]|uniref:zinc finger protein n=1 Tax=Actinosynnema sp. CS-041913 TaxID=3239917 RepID=UPI003D9317ED